MHYFDVIPLNGCLQHKLISFIPLDFFKLISSSVLLYIDFKYLLS